MGYIIRLSIANLKQRKLRTALTILGIMIGIMSMVTMLTAGIGAKSAMIEQVEKSGSTKEIRVYTSNNSRKDMLLTDSVVTRLGKLDNVSGVYPVLEVDGEEKMGSYMGFNSIVGVPVEYLELLELGNGELPERNGSRPKLLIDTGVKSSLYNIKTWTQYDESVNSDVPLTGKKIDFRLSSAIKIKEESTEEKKKDSDDEKATSTDAEEGSASTSSGSSSSSDSSDSSNSSEEDGSEEDLLNENSYDAKLSIVGEIENEYQYNMYTDMETLKMFLKRQSVDGKIPGQPLDKNENPYSYWCYSNIIVRADSTNHVEHLSKVIKEMGYQVSNNLESLKSVNKTIGMVQIILGGIGAIAGVVAIIGIINTMMTAVYDRIKEIGLLKMLGSDSDDISIMFLFESALLGGIGGILGLGLALIANLLINRKLVELMEMPEGSWIMGTPLWLAVLAVVISIIISVLAGAFPARWASKIKPLDAIGRS